MQQLFFSVDASIKVPIVRDGMALLIQKLYRMHIESM